MTRAIAVVLVLGVVSASTGVRGQDKVWPCEHETEPLMKLETSWQALYRAASSMPDKCFDGYFAEGISDTLVRKMGREWSGFTTLLIKHKDNARFFGLIIKSINATLNAEDVDAIERLSKYSCPARLQKQCDAIQVQIGEARKDFGT
jgi:hypothetical protein